MKKIMSFLAGIAVVASMVGGVTSNAQAYSYPYGGLTCSPSVQSVNSGDQVTFSAYFAYTVPQYPYYQLTWQAVGGYPSTGTGTVFSTRFYTSSLNQTSAVTVTNGTETATCTVYVNGANSTPTPTPIVQSLSLVQYGRNVSVGQSGEYSTVAGRGNETVEALIHVRNTSSATLYNVRVKDLIPSGLNYLAGSTAVNGTIVGDAINTARGENVGTLLANQDVTVRFLAVIDRNSVPSWGQTTVQNTAQVRADGVETLSVQLPVILKDRASIAVISQVKTGPADSILLSLLISTVVTSLCALYMTAERQVRKDGLNFLR